MILTRISVFQPVFTTMMMLAIMIFGLFSWRSLAIDEYPNVDFPVIAIVTSWSGATPETVEDEITDVIEEAVASISGVESLRSTSSEGSSRVIIEFTLETDSIVAAQDVREKISALTGRLPDQADEPRIMRFDPTSSPIVSLALSGDGMSRDALTRLAEDVISPTLTSIPGVGSATIVGGVEREVHVEIDPDMLRANGVSLTEVSQAMRSDNLNFPAGSLDDATHVRSVQLNAKVPDEEALGDVVVVDRDGVQIRLRDLAEIRPGFSEAAGRAFSDGNESLSIDVSKVEGGNTVAVADAVFDAIGKLKDDGRLGGARIAIVSDDSEAVRNSYETVQATLIEGALLAVAIVFLFLNSWRSTVITGLTLPISILGTLAVISMLGFTLNTMTMMALTLSIGILIDDAIVVRENITRHLHMGKSHRQASLDGTNEIGLAVLATTLSICAVFIPLAFMDGMIGKFFLEFGITVSVAVLISLFVSFTLDPMMSSVWHDPDAHPEAKRGPIGRAVARFDAGFEKLAHIYRKILILALRHRKSTSVIAVLAFGASFLLVPLVGAEFMPPKDEGQITITLKTPVGSSKDYTALKVRQITGLLNDKPEVESMYSTISTGRNGANEARIVLSLVSQRDRGVTTADFAAGVRPDLARIPGAEITMSASRGVGGGRSPISIRLSGRSPIGLEDGARLVSQAIASVEGTKDITLSLDDAQPIHEFSFRREDARDLGIDAQSAGNDLRMMIAGEEVGEIDGKDGISIPVVVRLPERLRYDIDQISDLPIARNDERFIALSEIAELKSVSGPAKIEREERSRVVTVTAGIEGRLLGEIMADVDARIAAIDLPEGVHLAVGGEAEMMQDTVESMGAALLLAVICIYLVLASQFGSFLQPIAIMASLPFSLAGVLLGLIAGGSSINMYSMIGFIMLMGLVVKNGILLVDNSNQHRREGMDLVESLIQAGHTRFRPIIMTTLAMIFGMLPLALAFHEGSEQNAPMAHAVIGGLISSTLLTLIVVPVMVLWMDQLSTQVKSWFRPVESHESETTY